jgi:rSAM-associated Gly-rich repeat protein
MSTRKSLRQTLSLVLPAGALGASILLGLASQTANARSAATAAEPESVSDQLTAIRATVSELSTQSASGGSAEPEAEGAKAETAWWGNGGRGRWRLGWGNGGGWHNGGWGNGGWGNGGWHNWGNGWHNFWHNW